MSPALFDGMAIVTALGVGFALKYGGLCTYAAALQMVRQRDFERLAAFLGAAAAATLLILPVAWWHGNLLQLPATHLDWNSMIAGGLLIGAGAWLNRGCFFGTFVQLVGGNLTYLATLAGLLGGALSARWWLAGAIPETLQPTPAATPEAGATWWIVLALLFLLAVMARSSSQGRLVLLVLGLGGGWLYASVSGWSL